jgi:cation-transporting ATPase 13A1
VHFTLILPTHISLVTLSFFVQVFCIALWCLDEYWYYSLFTLFMLFLFESTMAKNRLKTLTELRRVKVDNQIVLTYRCGKYGSFI